MTYFIEHSDKFIKALIEHFEIVGITLLFSVLLAAVITALIQKSKRLSNIVIQIFGAVYSIPSLALFAILIPITGLGMKTAIPVLIIYNQFLLLRNIIAGLDGVDKNIVEAATGMGMTDFQVFTKIKIPLALPMIIAGIRLAIVSTIGIATIAATISAGGLGKILFEGLRSMNIYKLVWGTILCVVVAAVANGLLKIPENALKRKMFTIYGG